MTIEEFIEARIAEDEQAAQLAVGASWVSDIPPAIHVEATAIADDKQRFGSLGYVGTVERVTDRSHVVRHDPARVLRQCAAWRRALEDLATIPDLQANLEGEFGSMAKYREILAAGPDLGFIAAIWSDHPDYQREWA